MICVFCKKKIESKDNYHKNIEMNNGEEMAVDYYHQTCWHSFTNQMRNANASLSKSNYLLGGLTNHMRKMGILPEQEVVVA